MDILELSCGCIFEVVDPEEDIIAGLRYCETAQALEQMIGALVELELTPRQSFGLYELQADMQLHIALNRLESKPCQQSQQK